MSVKVMSLVWDAAPYRGNTLLVLLALADWANDEGLCWPKLETLARKSRQSKRSCQYAIEQLAADRLLTVTVNRGRGVHNDYQLNMQNLHLLQKKTCNPRQENMQSATQKGAKHDSAIRKNRHRSISEPSFNTPADAGAVLTNEPLQIWMSLKARLLKECPEESEWLRPMYFLKLMSNDTMLLALPPAGRIIAAARAQQRWLDLQLQPFGFSHRLTRYPDDYELGRIAEEFPEVFAELPEPLQKRKPQSAVSA